jgi:elongation factor Ts
MEIKINPSLVKELREATGAGMMNCKKALEETEGNYIEAINILRQKGLALANKKVGRQTCEGLIGCYIHTGGKLGVLYEINCETDFVARRPEFQEFAKNIGMQIAACPLVSYISINDIPNEVIELEKSVESKKEDLKNKPEDIKTKIISERISKILKTRSLLDQPFIKDTTQTVENLMKQLITLTGENIKISRFVKFQLGGEK